MYRQEGLAPGAAEKQALSSERPRVSLVGLAVMGIGLCDHTARPPSQLFFLGA